MENPSTVKPGDVVQINENDGRAGWIGAFAMVTEVRSWGVVAFVAHVASHDDQQRAFIRLEWSHVERVGAASIVPQDVADGTS